MAINTGRVVAGGLVAGVVANAIDFVTNTYVLGADMQAWAASHNIDPATLTSGLVAGTWVAVDFIYGLLIVFTYAAIRPRFGPGVTTAIIAGFVVFLAPTIVLFGFTQMGMLTTPMWVKGAIGAIVATLAAAVAGAAVYKEEGAATPAFARG
ncbi:MAG TPA: hypothetical protein VN654_07170 [Vicinamibacterales bacterium]|jgi:hypothetical protein|nr:hypothetical protein [Vicinamibacterales bacterium]